MDGVRVELLAGENGTPDGDGVDSLAKWGATLVLLGCALYLAISNASWWVWVGNSALRGIREPKDIGLGIQYVFFASAPFVAAVSVFWWTARSSRSRRRRVVMASLAGTGVTVVAIFYSAALTGPL